MWNSSIWPIDSTFAGATTQDQSGPGIDGNEGVLCIPQSSSITGTSPSDFLSVIARTLWKGGSYLSAEMQLVCILQPHPFGLYWFHYKVIIKIKIVFHGIKWFLTNFYYKIIFNEYIE